MRTISAKELAGLKRKGGVRVKRRRSTEKPEPEVKDNEPLSEVTSSETAVPAPASDAFLPIMNRMTDVIERLELCDGSKKPSGILVAAKEEEQKEQQLMTKIKKAVALAIAALPKSKNIQTIVFPKKARKESTLVIERKDGLMSKIISTDAEGNKWAHVPTRSRKGLIERVTTTPI